MRPFAFAILAAALGPGCARCQGWADVPVNDPDALATAEGLDAVRAGIDQIAAWTGRDETCVDEVRVVDALDHEGIPLGGHYISTSRRVEVVADTSLQHVTTHEFCHAVDHEEGWISLDNADVLAAHADATPHDVYETEDARTREAFARICAEGPVLSALYAALSEACGVEGEDPAVLFVDEAVFAPREETSFDTFTAEATWTPIDGTERAGASLGALLVAGGAGALALDLAGAGDDDDYRVSPQLLRLDGATVTESLALDPHAPVRDANDNPTYTVHALLGSTGDPLLVSLLDGAAWRVRSDPLALEAVDFPAFDPNASLEGFEHEGRAFVLGTLDGADVLALVDLDAGTITPVAEGEQDLFRADEPVALYADAEGGVAVFRGGAGAVIVGLDWDGEVTWRHPLPGGDDRLRALTRLGDGTVLVAARVSVPAGEFGGAALLPMRLEPVDGAWSVPDGGCDGWPAYEGWALVGDAPTVLYAEAAGDGDYRLLRGELAVSAR